MTTERRRDHPASASRPVAVGAATAGGGGGRLRFEVDGLERYLVVDGRWAYGMGSTCDTCALWFTRLAGSTERVSIEGLGEALRRGLDNVSPDVADAVAAALPAGAYLPLLLDVRPRLVRPSEPGDYFTHEQVALWGVDGFWDLPHDPRVPYYRAGELDLPVARRPSGRARLYELVVPLYPPGWLDGGRVAFYADADDAGRATALAVSVLDVRQPAVWRGDRDPAPDTHWCLAHYLLDGHHKLFAAAQAGRPVRLLAFVVLSMGTATEDEVSRLATLLRD